MTRRSGCPIVFAAIAASSIALSLASTHPSVAAPPTGFVALPSRVEPIAIEGVSSQIRYTPFAKLQVQDGKLEALVWVELDLGDLQAALPSVLNRRYQDDECGDRVEVRNIAMTPKGEIALLRGSVTYERWECVKTHIPEFRGFKVTMVLKTVGKTKLVEQTAEVCVDLKLIIADDKQGAKLIPEVTCVEPSRSSLLGAVKGIIDFGAMLNRITQDELDKALGSKLAVQLPADIAALGVRVTAVRFAEQGDGRLMMVAEGVVPLTADAAKLLVSPP